MVTVLDITSTTKTVGTSKGNDMTSQIKKEILDAIESNLLHELKNSPHYPSVKAQIVAHYARALRDIQALAPWPDQG